MPVYNFEVKIIFSSSLLSYSLMKVGGLMKVGTTIFRLIVYVF